MQAPSAQLLPQVTAPIGTKTHDGYCQVKSPFVPLNVQQQRSKPADDGASPDQPRLSPSTTRLVKRLGLKHITTDVLMIRRRRHGRGFGYFRPDGTASRRQRSDASPLSPYPQHMRTFYTPPTRMRISRRSAGTRLDACNIAIIRNGSGCARHAKRADLLGWRTRCRAFNAASAST